MRIASFACMRHAVDAAILYDGAMHSRAYAVLGVALLACGPSVDDDDDGGAADTSTSTTAESTTMSTASASSSSTGSSSTTAVDETTGVEDTTGPGGIACNNEVCTPDQLCEWAKDSCGAPTKLPDQQRCSDFPSPCDDAPVCGCDGMIYQGACAAFDAGVDVDARGGCAAPPGLFRCGAGFCVSGQDWCLAHFVDITIEPDEYGCRPLPAACNGMATCDCVTGEDECVEWSCDMLDGGVVISC